jgi:hypothetical protein
VKKKAAKRCLLDFFGCEFREFSILLHVVAQATFFYVRENGSKHVVCKQA